MNTEIENKLFEFNLFLEENKFWFKKDYHIKFDTYFKSGGIVKFYCMPQTIDDFICIIKYLREKSIDFKIIGFTSNILLFDHCEYAVIISTKQLTSLIEKENYVEVECGYSLQDFVRVMSVLHKSEGYEGLEGIPGSVGGGIFMNAAAYGSSISDQLLDVTVLNSNGEVEIIEKKSCHFDYRYSIFKKDLGKIILKARFNINIGDSLKIENRIERFHIARHSYQEWVYPNLGSMISLNRDIYHEILKKDKFRLIQFWILKIIYKNSIIKLFRRKNPDNKIFNILINRFLGEFTIQPSKKSINILINNGDSDIEGLFNYLKLIYENVGRDSEIENEFVFNSIYKINPDKLSTHKMIEFYFLK